MILSFDLQFQTIALNEKKKNYLTFQKLKPQKLENLNPKNKKSRSPKTGKIKPRRLEKLNPKNWTNRTPKTGYS